MTTALPKEELRAIFATLSGMPPARVIWDGEAKGWAGKTTSGKTGHLVLDLLATRSVGVDEETRTYSQDASGAVTTTVTYSGQRIRTISVRAEAYDDEWGTEILESIRIQLSQDDTCALLNAAGLALNSTQDVLDLDSVAGNKSVSFATMDVRFNQMLTRIVTNTSDAFIDTVAMSGDPELNTIGPFSVTSVLDSDMSLAVADLPSLAVLATGPLSDGTTCYVQTLKTFFVLDKTDVTTPADPTTCIVASGISGRWRRHSSYAHPTWLAVNDWYINASTGNDENDGIDPARPLKTAAELSRRWAGGTIRPTTFGQSGSFIGFYCTIHLQTTLPDSDPIFPNCRSGAKTVLFVKGGVDGAVLYSGTLSGIVAKNNAAYNASTALGLVDASATWGSLLGKRWRIPSGTRQGMTGWIAKDLGSSTARSSESGTLGPMNPAFTFGPLAGSSFTPASPVVGDSYLVENLITVTIGNPTTLDAGSAQNDTTTFTRPKVVWSELAIRNSLSIENAGVIFCGCDFQSAVVVGMPGATVFTSCHFGFGLRVNTGVVSVLAGLFDTTVSANAFGLECFQMGSCTIQNGALFQNVGIHGSSIVINDVGVFDSAATGANAALGHGISIAQTQVSTQWARTAGWVFFLGPFWGQGNAGCGVHLSAGAKAMTLQSFAYPICTGALGDFELNRQTQARAFDDSTGAYTTKRNCTYVNLAASLASGGFNGQAKDVVSGSEWIQVIP